MTVRRARTRCDRPTAKRLEEPHGGWLRGQRVPEERELGQTTQGLPNDGKTGRYAISYESSLPAASGLSLAQELMDTCDQDFDLMAGWFAGTHFEFLPRERPARERCGGGRLERSAGHIPAFRVSPDRADQGHDAAARGGRRFRPLPAGIRSDRNVHGVKGQRLVRAHKPPQWCQRGQQGGRPLPVPRSPVPTREIGE